MTRLRVLTAAAALLLAACGTSLQDDAMPECSLRNGSAVLLMAQAVPSAELVPCIVQLESGWSLGATDATRGSAGFSLDSAAMGDAFLAVELQAICPAGAEESTIVVPGGDALLSSDVDVTSPPELSVAVVPAAGRHAVFSSTLAADLNRREVTTEVLPVGTRPEARVGDALAGGQHVLLVDDRALDGDLVEWYDASTGQPRSVARDAVVDLLDDLRPAAQEQAYEGTWQFRFDGGCVTYLFDAKGPGAAALGERAPEALSFVSRTTLDRFTRVNTGLRLDP